MMHDDQVDIDIARQMIRDQFPQYRHEDITSVGSSGTVNALTLPKGQPFHRAMLLLRLPRGMAEKEIVAETGYFSLTIFRRPFRRTSGD